jgi:hypothetical protein
LFLAAHDGSGMRVSALRCPTTAKAATPRNSGRLPPNFAPLFAGRDRIASAMPTGRANARPMTGSASSGAIRVMGEAMRSM